MLPEEKHKDWKPKIEFESEMQKKLRDIFGLDVVFHYKDGQKPFGYSLIDHKTETVYKGNDIIKMNELFELTDDRIDKKLFESLKDYNITDAASKKILMEYLKRTKTELIPKDFMLFETKRRKIKDIFESVKKEAKDYMKNQNSKDLHLIKSEDGKYYLVHTKLHYVGALEHLIGEKEYQNFLNPHRQTPTLQPKDDENLSKELSQSVNDLLFQFTKTAGSGKDPAEEEFKKRRKRR